MISRKSSRESQTGRSGRQSSQGSACSTACSFRRSRSDWGGGRAPPRCKSVARGPGPHGTGWATSSTQGPWQGAGRGDKSGAMGEGVRLCRSGDSRPLRWEGIWHKRWHPGFQGPRQGAMSLPALGGETGERCAGSQGPERVSTKLMRQAGRQVPGRSGGTVVPMSKAQCSAQPLDSPVPVGSLQVPEGFRVGKCLRSLSAHHLFQGKQLMPGPRAGSGGVGVWDKGTGEAHGKQGEEAATASRAARGLPGRPLALTHLSSEAAWAPSRCSCARCDLSPLGHSRAGATQKMLCRRFFPRPGCWKARPR